MSLVFDKRIEKRQALTPRAESDIRSILNFIHDVMLMIQLGVERYTCNLSGARPQGIAQKNVLLEVCFRFERADRITFRVCSRTEDSISVEMLGYHRCDTKPMAGFAAHFTCGPNGIGHISPVFLNCH